MRCYSTFFGSVALRADISRHIDVESEDEEIEEFLKEQGLGVLGFTNGSEAYMIPIAFAYDRSTDRCLFRFLMEDESMKRAFVAETGIASLTVYEWRPGTSGRASSSGDRSGPCPTRS